MYGKLKNECKATSIKFDQWNPLLTLFAIHRLFLINSLFVQLFCHWSNNVILTLLPTHQMASQTVIIRSINPINFYSLERHSQPQHQPQLF